MFCNGTENAIVNRSITIITKQQQQKKKGLDELEEPVYCYIKVTMTCT